MWPELLSHNSVAESAPSGGALHLSMPYVMSLRLKVPAHIIVRKAQRDQVVVVFVVFYSVLCFPQ